MPSDPAESGIMTGGEMDTEEQSTSTRSWLTRTWDGVRRRLPQIPQSAADIEFLDEQPDSVCFTEGIGAALLIGAGAGALAHYQWKKTLRTQVVGIVSMWIFGLTAFTSCRAPKLARLMREKAERDKRALQAAANDG